MHDPDSHPKSSAGVPIVSIATSMAAPAIVIGAATAFFSGTVYLDHLLNHFGLAGAALQASIQVVMATGYSAILQMVIIAAIGLVLCIALLFWLRSYRQKKGSAPKPRSRLMLAFSWLYMITFLMGFGWLSGSRAADVEYRRLYLSVQEGCHACFLYNTTRGRVVGMPIGQDERVLILATRRGVAVLPTASVKAIRAINPRQPLPGPAWLPF